jgi:hypothetical protein
MRRVSCRNDDYETARDLALDRYYDGVDDGDDSAFEESYWNPDGARPMTLAESNALANESDTERCERLANKGGAR